jgi:nucleoside 2-deoxyribosyltransferase
MRVYLAGPLFTVGERMFNTQLAELLSKEKWINLYVPQETMDHEPNSIYFKHIGALERCDAVVAILDGPDIDSGTAFEVGYAVAQGRPVVGVRTDFRRPGDTAKSPYNLMLNVPLAHELNLSSMDFSISEVARSIILALSTLKGPV